MKKIIKYIIVIGIGLVIAFLIALSKDVFNVTDKKTIYHIFSDSFMVPGVITAGMGLLIYVSDQGVFDGIVYGIMAFMNMFSPRNERKYNSLYEYKEKKHATKTKIGFILLSGLFLLAISVIMLVLYEKA